jgi:tetratricopeptide (TPR) repeat protein
MSIEICRKAIAENADTSDFHANLGLALRKQGELQDAIEACKTAIRIDPEFAEAHNNLGLVFMDAGEIDRAMECFREALRLDPTMTSTSLNMARARRFGEADLPEIARIESLLERDDILREGRINLHFALGKMLEDCGRYDQAFAHFRKGNEYKRGYVRFDSEHYRRWCARIREVFTAKFFAGNGALGDPSERPVFIVGMPRSGTTLVEQILASHPQVFGAGELRTIVETVCTLEARDASEVVYPELVAGLDEAAIHWAGQHYLDTLRSMDEGADRVTDKMPTNFFHLGIIHCRRDAMDICVSNFVLLFGEGHYYSYDLADIASYYRGYEQMMAHWKEVLPIRMYEVQYEELVTDQERISRELVDYIGLDWDDRCLEFHQTRRAVQTASNWQVRQPIYKSARKRWKHYEKNLAQLKSDLNYVERD